MTTHLILQSPGLDLALIDQTAALCEANGTQWISKSAARLMDVQSDPDTQATIAAWAEKKHLDVAFVQAQARLDACKVLVMDMDSTLINIECIDEIAAYAGLKSEVAAITERSMRGEITEFSDSLKQRVSYLKGLSSRVLEAVFFERLALNPGAEKLINTAKQAGLKTLLVSGGFTFFTERLKEKLHFDAAHGNTLDIDAHGNLTGQVSGRIIDAQGKADILAEFAATHGASADQIIAVGDGANDLKMMAMAHYSVAYRAKPVVRTQANFALNVSPLDGILNWFGDV